MPQAVTILSPMYTPAEQWQADVLMNALNRADYYCVSPHRVGDDPSTDSRQYGLEKELFELLATPDVGDADKRLAILLSSALNFFSVCQWTDATVLVMDGRTPDEASVFWAAVAFASGKPVITYKSDYRCFMSTGDNSMVTGLSVDFEPERRWDHLADRVKARIEGSPAWDESCLPSYNQSLLLLGKKVAEQSRDHRPAFSALLEQFREDPQANVLLPVDSEQPASPPGRAYCSGPLFCPSEIHEMKEIALALEKHDLRTYLPHRDGVEALIGDLDNPTLRANAIANHMADINSFYVDVYQLVECDRFVINLNGRVPDDGAVSEAGMAFAMGRPCVLFRTDPRSFAAGCYAGLHPALQMAGHLFETVPDCERIFDELERRARFLGKFGNGYRPPESVKTIRDAGEKFYSDLHRMYTGKVPITEFSNRFLPWRVAHSTPGLGIPPIAPLFQFWREYHPYSCWPEPPGPHPWTGHER